MPKPNSIRVAQLLLVFKLAMFAFILAVSLLLLVVPDGAWSGWADYKTRTLHSMFGITPEEYEAKHFWLVAVNLAPLLLALVLTLVSIAKKKRMLSILLALLVFWLSSSNPVQLLLSLVIVVLLLLRSSRLYFEGGQSASPAAAAPVETAGGAEEVAEDAKTREPEEAGSQDEPPETRQAADSERKPKADPAIEIRDAGPEDAQALHAVTLAAFEEYRAAVPPSSALEETESQIREALAEQREFAGILYEDGNPVGAVRYRFEDHAIVFFRLAVVPSRRKRGYARKLVEWVELKGRTKGVRISRCKVRQSIHKKMFLFENMGYEIADQELAIRPAGTVKFFTLEKNLEPK